MLFPFQKDQTCAIESEEQKITEPFAAECAKEVTGVGERSTARGLMGLMTETGEGFINNIHIFLLLCSLYIFKSFFFFSFLFSLFCFEV